MIADANASQVVARSQGFRLTLHSPRGQDGPVFDHQIEMIAVACMRVKKHDESSG